MDFEDLGEVVRIHSAAFPGFFLTRMGQRFLAGYYKTVLEFPNSVAIVAESKGSRRLLGFAVGFTDTRAFYDFFAGRRRRLIPATFLALLRSPSLIVQILRNRKRVSAQAEAISDAAELSSIAVDDAGRGIGSLLLKSFLSAVASKGIQRVVLITDAENNAKTRGFYERHGFVIAAHERRGGRLLCQYSISC